MQVYYFAKIYIFAGLFSAIVCINSLNAAPLDSGSLAPPVSVTPGEARSRVLAAAEKYEHTPYVYGGMDRRGLDCSGLVYLSYYDALGVAIPRSTWSLYSWAERISIKDALPGDLLFFTTTGSGNVSHVGIFIGNGRFIHAASEGPETGVIYSSLDERYWSRTYIGTGRVLPAADMPPQNDNRLAGINNKKTPEKKPQQKEDGHVLIGFAAAPTWNTFLADAGVIRGAAGQLRMGLEVKPFGQPMIFGMEIRPEWDRALGIFRVPFTLSWGINDKLRFFAGPALSFGDASLTVSGESRRYTGGTNWFGAAGVTAAPFALQIAGIKLAPYGELAWQSYYSNNNDKNLGADIAAGFRFSTGLSCTWRK